MPFAYYDRLSPSRKRIYRQSDEITSIRLPGGRELRPIVQAMAAALAAEDRPAVEREAAGLLAGISAALGVPRVRVRVLAVRPARNWGELHGLYVPGEHGAPATITVWMRTAQRRQVVRFRTFFRTLIHEVGHHLDYELLHLAESFHTQGFYQRESSLVHQLLEAPRAPARDSTSSSSSPEGPIA